MYYAFALRTGSPHRVLCSMYYVLCIMYYALPLGVHIVCYVLCITYYVLRTGSPHRMLCIMYYVLCTMRHTLRTYNPSQLMAARAAAPVRAHKGGWGGDA